MEDTFNDPRPSEPQIHPATLWKWRALFERPAPLEFTWQQWLAAAQRDEQVADLRHWALRHHDDAA